MDKIQFRAFIYSEEKKEWQKAIPYINNQEVKTFIYLNIPILDQYQYPNTILNLQITKE